MDNNSIFSNMNPFSTPKGYFENLENLVMLKKDTTNNPFITPDNYFEGLNSQILSNTIFRKGNRIGKKKIIFLFSHSLYCISAACIILVLSIAGIWYYNYNMGNKESYWTQREKALSTINNVSINQDMNKDSVSHNRYSMVRNGDVGKANSKENRIVYANNSNDTGNYQKQAVNKSSQIIYDLYFSSESLTDIDDEIF